MQADDSSAQSLIGKTLESFKLEDLTKVFKVDDNGRERTIVGYFRNEDVAVAFAGNQTDTNWYRAEKVLVITNGKTGFVLGKPATLVDDEQAALDVRMAAIAKLSVVDRKILGLS